MVVNEVMQERSSHALEFDLIDMRALGSDRREQLPIRSCPRQWVAEAGRCLFFHFSSLGTPREQKQERLALTGAKVASVLEPARLQTQQGPKPTIPPSPRCRNRQARARFDKNCIFIQ